MFDDITVEIECPECEKSFEISVSDVGKTVLCPHCSQEIELVDNGFTDGLNKAEEQIENLFNNL